jgi:TonB-linked SusC/RagA family outer membrane protein
MLNSVDRLQRMKKICLVSITLVFLSISIALAQTLKVSGRIVDSENGEGLAGATVLEEGTNNGTIADGDGYFNLAILNQNAELSISFIGYLTKVEKIGNRSLINFSLDLNIEELSEIVVIGYGSIRKSDLTGAVSSVKSEELVKIPASNPLQALQGKVAGVQVNNFSGEPGAAPTVRIRGVGTFNNNNPVYVVDGVILDDIGFINSNDIQSLEVLKDASATAIYGSRGANGVILITTKRGAKGQLTPIVTVSSEISMQSLQKKIELLDGNKFSEIVNILTPGTYNNLDALPSTDWQDVLFTKSPIQSYQVSVAGATNKSQYYFSVAYFKQDGIIPHSSFGRISIRVNNDYQISKRIKLGHNLSFVPTKSQSTNGGAPFNVYRAQPNIAPYTLLGAFSEVPGVGNVLADLEYTNSFSKGLQLVGNFFLEVALNKAFHFRTSYGPNISYTQDKGYTPAYYVSATQNNAIDDVRRRYAWSQGWLFENTINFNKNWDKHRIDALVGFTTQDNSNEFISGSGQNLLRSNENFWYLTQNNLVASSISNGIYDDNNYYSMVSYLGRVNYVYDNKYLFTATFRRDGSSKFLDANKWGSFPSLAVGWNLINESFMKSLSVFSNAKIRASWGIVGNEKIPYQEAYSTISDGTNAIFGPNEQQFVGQSFGKLGNPDLKWESTKTLDFGFEWGLLRDKLVGEIDYFRKNTYDILVALQVPGYYGNSGGSVFYNAGEVRNKGWEMTTSWTDQIGDFQYKIQGNYTHLTNSTQKVSGTGGSDDALYAFFNGYTVTKTTPGVPIGSFYGYQTAGIFQNIEQINNTPHLATTQPGDLIFVDSDGDGKINTADFVNLGSPIPTHMYGLSASASYMGLDLSVDFQGQGGNKIYNLKEIVRPALYNFEAHVANYWTGEGTTNIEPRPTAGGPNFSPSDRFIYKGDFIRLRNVALSYTLPAALSAKIGTPKTRIFVSATNVFTLSEFPGYSPEVANGGAIFNGIDTSVYPVATVYSGGINVTFK